MMLLFGCAVMGPRQTRAARLEHDRMQDALKALNESVLRSQRAGGRRPPASPLSRGA